MLTNFLPNKPPLATVFTVLTLLRGLTHRGFLGGAVAIAGGCIITSTSVRAQSTPAPTRADTIRGTITAGNGTGLPGVRVVAVMAPDRLQDTTVTDVGGRYLLIFANGTGDYFLSASKLGWRPQHKRLTRVGTQPLQAWDTTVTQITTTLSGVKIVGSRERPPLAEYAEPVGASVASVPGISATFSPDQLGNPEAYLAVVAGAVPTADGVSVLGLSSDQTNTLLDGLAFSGSVPRDARTLMRVFTTAFDPARGGFSGAQTAIDLAPGTMWATRRARLTLDDPALQSGDGAANGLQNTYRQAILSAGADGGFASDRFTYNTAGQISHRVDNNPSLFESGNGALRALSVDPSAVSDLRSMSSALGIPLEHLRTTYDDASAIARLDFAQDTARVWSGVLSAERSRADGMGLSPLSAAEHTTRNIGSALGVQGSYVRPLPASGVNELKSGAFLTQRRGTPVSLLPSAIVLVGPADSGGVAALSLGGNNSSDRSMATSTWQTYDEAQWYLTNKQIAKVYVESRLDAVSQETMAPASGVFIYDSLPAFATNTPSIFSRSLDAPHAASREWSGVLALSDQWRPMSGLAIQLGVRSETSTFLNVPKTNDALRKALAVRTDFMPGGFHASPRLGFNWSYGTRGAGSRQFNSRLGTRVLGLAGALHGGIGEFRGTIPQALTLAPYAQTGLPTGTGALSCTGASVPSPDWAAYGRGEAAPTSCSPVDGPVLLGSNAPRVVAWDPSFQPPRSWRTNLGWSGYLGLFNLTVDGTLTRNLNQRSVIDANFRDVPQFVLSGERERPVYAPVGDIDLTTQLISPGATRSDAAFSSVSMLRSDAHSTARQLIVDLTPNLNFGHYFASVAYALTDVTVTDRGLDGSTFGDPSALETHRSLLPGRQQWHLSAGYNAEDGLALTFVARFYQGERFTPLIDRDINGDGFANDRAYIPAPGASTNSPVDMTAFNEFLKEAPSYVRQCLMRQVGAVAGVGSCQAPWSVTTNAQLLLPQLPGVLGRRARIRVNLANPAGLLDIALHGQNGMRGWGSPNTVDPVLLRVRSFDPTVPRFTYDVNPAFGRPELSQLVSRLPFRISIDVSMDLGIPLEVQQLGRVLHQAAHMQNADPVAKQIANEFAGDVPNLYTSILRQSDSLLLSTPQVTALQLASDRYRPQIDSVWTELAEQINALPQPYDRAKVYTLVDAAVGRAWAVTQSDSRHIRAILSPIQLQLAPATVRTVVRATKPVRFPGIVVPQMP